MPGFPTAISETEDEAAALADVDMGTRIGHMPIQSQSTSPEHSGYDPLRHFSGAIVRPQHCLARIVKAGAVCQCSNRPKVGGDLCSQHAKHRGKIRARYGKVTEDVPISMVAELQEKLHQIAEHAV